MSSLEDALDRGNPARERARVREVVRRWGDRTKSSDQFKDTPIHCFRGRERGNLNLKPYGLRFRGRRGVRR
jgi:hypothetical protein